MNAKLYRMRYVRPLGLHIPLDAAAMEAYHRELNAQAWRERWKRIGAWLGFVTICAVCWYAIIWLAYKATEGR